VQYVSQSKRSGTSRFMRTVKKHTFWHPESSYQTPCGPHFQQVRSTHFSNTSTWMRLFDMFRNLNNLGPRDSCGPSRNTRTDTQNHPINQVRPVFDKTEHDRTRQKNHVCRFAKAMCVDVSKLFLSMFNSYGCRCLKTSFVYVLKLCVSMFTSCFWWLLWVCFYVLLRMCSRCLRMFICVYVCCYVFVSTRK
jgi:hypothetical protein